MLYVIASSPRTGSTLLTDALKRTDVAGVPEEYWTHRNYWNQCLGIDYSINYLDQIAARTFTSNGLVGVKLFSFQIDEFTRDLSASGVADVRYVRLRRRDTVAQGVSYYRAAVGGSWRCDEPGRPVEFDLDEIARHVESARGFDRAWDEFFRNREVPLAVDYEELRDDYERTVTRVLSWLGIVADVPPPSLERQADEASEEWVREYRRLRGDG